LAGCMPWATLAKLGSVDPGARPAGDNMDGLHGIVQDHGNYTIIRRLDYR
jgi:hypothetical protein